MPDSISVVFGANAPDAGRRVLSDADRIREHQLPAVPVGLLIWLWAGPNFCLIQPVRVLAWFAIWPKNSKRLILAFVGIPKSILTQHIFAIFRHFSCRLLTVRNARLWVAFFSRKTTEFY